MLLNKCIRAVVTIVGEPICFIPDPAALANQDVVLGTAGTWRRALGYELLGSRWREDVQSKNLGETSISRVVLMPTFGDNYKLRPRTKLAGFDPAELPRYAADSPRKSDMCMLVPVLLSRKLNHTFYNHLRESGVGSFHVKRFMRTLP